MADFADTSGNVNHGPHLHISSIAVSLRKSFRSLKSVNLSIDDELNEHPWERSDDKTLQITFKTPLDLVASHRLSFHLRYSYQMKLHSEEQVSVDADQLIQAPSHTGDRREWRRSFEKVDIVIMFSLGEISHSHIPSNPDSEPHSESPSNQGAKLIPTTEDIFSICPHFRILLVGKTGVGKSSLINKAFGVDTAKESHIDRGQADINLEILSNQNKRFVLHDSLGLEPGEVDNLKIVRNFIADRDRRRELKDQLHAVWLCFGTPIAGGRIFEAGVETFLLSKKDGSLGEVPVIAVFTKYDELVDRELLALYDCPIDGLKEEDFPKHAKKNAGVAFAKECIEPFNEVVAGQVPYRVVSTQPEYEDTLVDLIQLTFKEVEKHVAKNASILAAIAQRVDASVKIDGSIAVGRSRYWAGLASGIDFLDKKLAVCLDVLHTDIVAVWNFQDPSTNLDSDEFKAMMSNMVGDKTDASAPAPGRNLIAGASMLAAIAGIISTLSGPAAPIVLPIVAGCVLAKWAHDAYKLSAVNVKHIMAYIVDLTLVMQNLFWLTGGQHVASRRLIKLSFKAYYESETKARAHGMIAKLVKEKNLFAPGARDAIVEKIVETINRHRIDPMEMIRLKDRLGPYDPSAPDEPWAPLPSG